MGIIINLTRKNFTINAQALWRLMRAVSGAPHEIRELQVIQTLERLPGQELSPITTVARSITAQLQVPEEEHNLAHMRTMYHNRQLRVNPLDVEFLLDVVHETTGIRLQHEQLVGILDLFPQAHVMLGIHGADTDPMQYVLDAVSQFFTGRHWPSFEETQHGEQDEDKTWLVDLDELKDQIKKGALELHFIA